MSDTRPAMPDNTALRVALWRALHVAVDQPPHVLSDEIGLRLAAPAKGWQRRGDMDSLRTARARASIVARSRFIEDLVEQRVAGGVGQYVVLGAGLDSFAYRRAEGAPSLAIYEIDQPETQAWKRQRLIETGLGIPDSLRLVPVDFEAGASWCEALIASGFDPACPAVLASAGVSMYLSLEANRQLLREAAALAPGSSLVMTFMPPMELLDTADRPARTAAEKGARAAGTPFVSYFTPDEIVALAREAGFGKVRHVSAADLTARYFANRTDGLRPSSAEELIVADV